MTLYDYRWQTDLHAEKTIHLSNNTASVACVIKYLALL